MKEIVRILSVTTSAGIREYWTTNHESRLFIYTPACLDNYGSRWYIISNYIQAVKRRVHKGFGKESSGGWEGVRKVYGTWPLSLSAEQ